MMDIHSGNGDNGDNQSNSLRLVFLVEAVEVSVVYAICLFSVRDGEVAKGHWRCILSNAVAQQLFTMMRFTFIP